MKNAERVKVYIENALDLLQLATEDIEDNFIGTHADSAISARATLSVSVLSVLHSYLQMALKEVGAGH